MRPAHPRPRRQRGALFIMFALMLTVLVGMMGLAIDLAQLYARRTDLQHVADGAALAAAGKLNGTAAGVIAAAAAAASAAAGRQYQFGRGVPWDGAALTFGGSATGAAWNDAAAAGAAALAPAMLYARVDTAALAPALGLVDTSLLAVLGGATSLGVAARAVAGRASIPVTPLGVCALSLAPAASRASAAGAELVEYGFRRGVGYNLLDLNPAGAAALSFVIDPLHFPGSGSANFSAGAVAPFLCGGSMAMAQLPPRLYVAAPFPPLLTAQLNARFGTYTTPPSGTTCDPVAAPPDRNVRTFQPSQAGWWNGTPLAATAASASAAPLLTVADLPVPSSQLINGPDYGVLWAYGPAARFVAAGAAAAGFAKGDWPALYPGGLGGSAAGIPASYPASGPYAALAGTYFKAPASAGVSQRRVLQLPLLDCFAGATGGTAAVLAVGRFLMTVPATGSAVSGEFAGAVSRLGALGGPVLLFQ